MGVYAVGKSRMTSALTESLLPVMGTMVIDSTPPATSSLRWETPEGPETTDYGDLHYLMTPYHALKLAEHNERRAAGFFERLAAAKLPAAVRESAAEMAAEEREHVRLIEEWLAKFPEPEPGWDEDPDPPAVAD